MRKGTVVTSIAVACTIVGALLVSSAVAQVSPFNDASLQGTYRWLLEVSASPDGPIPEDINAGLIYYAGDGTYRGISMYNNDPGEPDAEGNPTRDIGRMPTDVSTFAHWTGTYRVDPFGSFLWTWPAGDFDGFATRTEVLDGVLTIVEYALIARRPKGSTGGVWMFRHSRIADGDLLPRAPEE